MKTYFCFDSAKSETRKGSGPLTLELQLQPSVAQQNAYPPRGQPNPNVFISSPSSTPIPEPFETVKPNIDPVLAASLYQSQQINLNPTYSALRDENVLDPQTANALLQQQYYQTQGPYVAFRQNSDGSVSTYQTNRPTQPWFNWFGTNNNNNQNYQSDQPQQGPILSFLSNLAQNNPVTNFLNGFQPQQTDLQTQNPIQNFFNNLNPFNLFSNNNNNRPQMSLPIQSDYVSTMSPSNHLLSGNLDSSVFNQVNDHFLNPTQFGQNGNYNPNYNPGFMNQVGLNSPQLQTTTYPSVGMPTPIYSSFNQFNRPSYNQPFSTVPNNVQPYSQYYNHHQNYPIYQNPYQTISPITVTRNPLFNQKKKTNNKNSKKKGNKNQVDIPDSESDWFQDFLDKRKSASLDVSSKRPAKKASDEEDDDLDDYFR